MYAAEKTSIAEVQDEIHKVEGKLEELGKQTQEGVEKTSKVEKEGERDSFEGERTAVAD
jgi:hypothetical protein